MNVATDDTPPPARAGQGYLIERYISHEYCS